MSDADDERIAELEEALRRDDPRFARRLGAGRPCRPREYRRWRLSLMVAFALAATVVGAADQGLLVAVGLMVLGGSAHLWAAGPHRRRRHGWRRR